MLPLTLDESKYGIRTYSTGCSSSFSCSYSPSLTILTSCSLVLNHTRTRTRTRNKRVYDLRNISQNSIVDNLSPSYNLIRDILRDGRMTNYEKQVKIENTLRDYWKDEIYSFIINNKNTGVYNVGLNLVVRQLKNLDVDIAKLYNKKSFQNNKFYGKIIRQVPSSVILSVVMGKVIHFVAKYGNIEEQPTTKLFKDIGEAILKEIGLQCYKKDVESHVIMRKYPFIEYMKKKELTLSEEKCISMGLDLLHFFCHRSNFVEMKEVLVKHDLYKRMILPKEDFTKLIENITYIESDELPMLVPPVN